MRWAARSGVDVFDWHVWFAWYPVRIKECWYWLEKVERKMTLDSPCLSIDVEYRPLRR